MNRSMGAEPWVVRTQLPYAELLLTNDDQAGQARARTTPPGPLDSHAARHDRRRPPARLLA
jgi:hypothetical protein